jgi:hypothetical protein
LSNKPNAAVTPVWPDPMMAAERPRDVVMAPTMGVPRPGGEELAQRDRKSGQWPLATQSS